jgi:hypothetical protein
MLGDLQKGDVHMAMAWNPKLVYNRACEAPGVLVPWTACVPT